MLNKNVPGNKILGKEVYQTVTYYSRFIFITPLLNFHFHH